MFLSFPVLANTGPLPAAPLSTGNWSTADLENRRLLIGCLLEGIIFYINKRDFETLEAPFWHPGGSILTSWASILVIHGPLGTRLGTPLGPDLDFNDCLSILGPP